MQLNIYSSYFSAHCRACLLCIWLMRLWQPWLKSAQMGSFLEGQALHVQVFTILLYLFVLWSMTPGKNKFATIFFFFRDAEARDVCMIFSEQIQDRYMNLNLRIENENIWFFVFTKSYIFDAVRLIQSKVQLTEFFDSFSYISISRLTVKLFIN